MHCSHLNSGLPEACVVIPAQILLKDTQYKNRARRSNRHIEVHLTQESKTYEKIALEFSSNAIRFTRS